MYNESQKRAFIEAHTDSDKTAAKIAQIFSWFESYEEKWELDLSQQSAENLQPVINELSGIRTKSTENILYILKEYVKWCVNNGYKTSNGIFEVRVVITDKIRTQMVASPYHLSLILDTHFSKAEEETIDITYRVFLWMAFAGLEDKDAVRVTGNSVNLKDFEIVFEGHKYELYKECLDDFEKACSLTSFQYNHPNYTTRRDRAIGNTIMRGFRSPTVDLMTIRPVVNKKLLVSIDEQHPDAKHPISYNRIYLSGLFYRTYERERAGHPVNFSDIVAITMKNKNYTTTKTRTLTTIANTLEREYLADYERWKCAFAM